MDGNANSQAGAAETPSGKGAADENFPVGSFLLPRRLRPQVAAFYAYARAIDDIADNPDLTPEEKVARLDGFDRALTGDSDDPAYGKAVRIREMMGDVGNVIRHCRDLILAFKQDAVKGRYADWEDLMGYCDRSASPVGRFLLDLHDCPEDGYPASDALCNALQVINHLQDCKDDYLTLDRVYLPGDWMAEAGATVEDLGRDAASPGLRRVIDVSADGINNEGEEPRFIYAALDFSDVTVNALVIRKEDQTLTYFANKVIHGPGAFIQATNRYEDYTEAMIRKLLREILGLGYAASNWEMR